MLTKEQILAAKDVETVEINIPEWDGSVLVKGLTGKERDVFEDVCLKQRRGEKDIDIRGLKVKLLSLSIVDDAGNPIFTQEDVELLNEKSGAVINRLFEKAQELSGLSEKELKGLVKNSKGVLNENSGSGSPDS